MVNKGIRNFSADANANILWRGLEKGAVHFYLSLLLYAWLFTSNTRSFNGRYTKKFCRIAKMNVDDIAINKTLDQVPSIYLFSPSEMGIVEGIVKAAM